MSGARWPDSHPAGILVRRRPEGSRRLETVWRPLPLCGSTSVERPASRDRLIGHSGYDAWGGARAARAQGYNFSRLRQTLDVATSQPLPTGQDTTRPRAPARTDADHTASHSSSACPSHRCERERGRVRNRSQRPARRRGPRSAAHHSCHRQSGFSTRGSRDRDRPSGRVERQPRSPRHQSHASAHPTRVRRKRRPL